MTLGRALLADLAVGDDLPVAVVGALNVSPESFYAASVHEGDDLVRAALAMVKAGAGMIDVGARSTAPYLDTAIDDTEEEERLARAIERLAGELPVPISADTARAGPARAALAAGARALNDVTGLRDPAVGALVAERQASVILMASPAGSSEVGPPIATVSTRLTQALGRARAAGIPEERIVVDPGIGFFRETPIAWHQWDTTVLAQLGELRALGRPLAIGVSRKSFIGAITGHAVPDARLAGSLAATALAVLHGASVVRTHDVAETLDAVRVAERVREAAWR